MQKIIMDLQAYITSDCYLNEGKHNLITKDSCV